MIHEAIISRTHGSTPCQRETGWARLDPIACKQEGNFIGARRNLHNTTPAPPECTKIYTRHRHESPSNWKVLYLSDWQIRECVWWIEARPTDQWTKNVFFYTHRVLIILLITPRIRGADARFSAVRFENRPITVGNQEIKFECRGTNSWNES